jgi:hypothetical protein
MIFALAWHLSLYYLLVLEAEQGDFDMCSLQHQVDGKSELSFQFLVIKRKWHVSLALVSCSYCEFKKNSSFHPLGCCSGNSSLRCWSRWTTRICPSIYPINYDMPSTNWHTKDVCKVWPRTMMAKGSSSQPRQLWPLLWVPFNFKQQRVPVPVPRPENCSHHFRIEKKMFLSWKPYLLVMKMIQSIFSHFCIDSQPSCFIVQ